MKGTTSVSLHTHELILVTYGSLHKWLPCGTRLALYIACDYTVFSFVSCYDVEGILTHAAKRERTIPEATIRKYNVNRSRYFVEAADQLVRRHTSERVRAFVVERGKYASNPHRNDPHLSGAVLRHCLRLVETAAAKGVLTEVTSALPLVADPKDDNSGQQKLSENTAKQMLANCVHELRVNAGMFRDGVDTGAPATQNRNIPS
jgi:hypothetical protein